MVRWQQLASSEEINLTHHPSDAFLGIHAGTR